MTGVTVKTVLNVANVRQIAFDKSCIKRMTFKEMTQIDKQYDSSY